MQGLPLPSPTRRGPNSFIFMQFSAKSLQNNPFLGIGAPQEYPGSATASRIRDHSGSSQIRKIGINAYIAVADLHSKILDARPPWGSKFFQFHAVFGKIWQNRMLAPPPRGVGAPSSGKS